MAFAGLNNVSAISNSKPQVGERSMQESLIDSNEKENEHIVSPRRLQNDHANSTSSILESTDFGKVERERVRGVFRDWQNNGRRNNTPRDSHPNNNSKAKWLGEKECERKDNPQDVRSTDSSSSAGRFLKEKTYNHEDKSSSLAASELGILRRKQTVSNLREGFLSSKLQNFVSGSVHGVQSDTLSHYDIHCYRNEHTQASSLQDIVPDELCSQSKPTREENDINIFYTEDSECSVSEGLHQQKSEALVGESLVVMEIVGRGELSSTFEFNFWITDASGNSRRSSVDGRWPETLGIEGSQEGTLLEAHLSVTQGSDPQNNEIDALCASGDIDQLEGTVIEDINWQNIPLELDDWQDSVIEDGVIDWNLLVTAVMLLE
ncbi:hypothetical protein POM88_008199 [Heracleum sosnowskyi]|uniref:Uncharacterized protein n=1 Tax=Heracleum sosnowskyi TaxID=360622 RepID=A0AAD8J900_9APIA|nr:hypothetical protein POM88_008199 [Heracleum sosnowskyi]